jgi:outer membrane receptor protein involved in Fe transport
VFSVDNVLNDEYLVTYLNAQGNHYAEPRTFKIGVQFKSK